MTTLPAEFLAAVIAAPDDDNPRLIAADWLDERGDVRGEFIRVQVELARTPEPAVTTQGRIAADDVDDMRSRCRRCREVPAGLCRWHELCRRERELLDRYTFGFIAAPSVPNRAWRLDSDPLCADDPAFLGCTFRRGFIESITCDWASWLIAHEHVYWHPAQPRDCPPGACPIRRVALTSGPVVRWTDATGRNEWCQLAAPDGTPVGDELRADSLADARQLLLARMWPGITFELSARNGLDNHPEFTALRHNRYRVGQSVRFTMHVPGGTPTNPECEVVQVAGPRGGGFPVPARVDGNTVFADYAANAPGTFDVHMRAMANGQRLHTATTFSVADDPFA
jgi:uncharacterized protein (TIGR02996 family)